MKCKDVRERLQTYVDNELSATDREAVEAHLALCSACRDELEALANTLEELRQGLKEVAAGASPSPNAWGRIREQVAKEDKKTPLLDLGGLVRRMRPQEGWPVVTWERVAVCGVLIAAMVVGLLAVTARQKQTVTVRSLGPIKISANLGENEILRFSSYEDLKKSVAPPPTATDELQELKASANVEYEGGTCNIISIQNTGTAPEVYDQALANGVLHDYIYLACSNDDSSGNTAYWDAIPERQLSSLLGAPQSPTAYRNVIIDAQVSTTHSATNLQVEGVDEADIAKTDGRYIYSAVGNKVFIVKAYPAEVSKILSELELDGDIIGIYINGDKLIIFDTVAGEGQASSQEHKTYIEVYDVSDTRDPRLDQRIGTDGDYWSSRMIGDYVYMVCSQHIYDENNVTLPQIYIGDTPYQIPPENILHPKDQEYGQQFTTILSFNIKSEVKDLDHIGYGTFLLGSTSRMYASQKSLYITSDKYNSTSGRTEGTAIHRITLEDGILEYGATGEVPGYLLSQFSMDENDGYLRVATTTGWSTSISNNAYVLDSSMNTVGKLENLTPGESLYSARFTGRRGYLATFQQDNPLLAIDFSNPENPTVLGDINTTGYSYLHPYDENHIIGIGTDPTGAAKQGVNISLLDVSDVSNPKEIANYTIGDQGTDSLVLNDHKALLFDRARNLLVIPVLLTQIGNSDYVWQGVYVFDISVDEGLQLRGQITHYDTGYNANDSTPSVKRALYVSDVLYTISDAKIQMNDLESLDYINQVELS